ncbi:hypothetical protein BDV24DRAFT_132942 [Aspergillus arachidicola]|uniref:Uncharacterized protein n=1 Tax=Aspergillus arachidicola TaxID=656916 RepID=A0A5N6Y6J6_9EURO|nr:hypothetical protein BDV24DRAFT_132942 [Aspergillus arachidicola]
MHTHTPHSNTSDNRRCQFPSNTYQKRPATQLAQTNMPMTSFSSGPGNVFSLALPLQRLVLFAGACLDARLFQVVGNVLRRNGFDLCLEVLVLGGIVGVGQWGVSGMLYLH